MNHFFKQKQPYLAIIVVFLVILLLGVAQLGSTVNPVPKNLPVVLVQMDAGEKLPTGQDMNFGKLIQDKITAAPAQADTVSPLKWTTMASEQEAIAAMDREQAYAAIIIPADFSHKLASLLSPGPQASSLTLYVNQGMNNTAATMANGVLGQILNGINGQVREQLLAQVSQKGGTLTVDQTKAFASPILVTSKNVNAVGTNSANGNAPVVLTQLAWFGAMVTTLFLYMAAGKATQTGLHRFGVQVSQILSGVVLTAVSAVSILLVAGKWLGLSIPSYWEMGLFLTFVGFAFFLLQTAVVSWLGLKGVPLFVLIFFFGAPVLSLPPELLPSFSHDLLYSWLPLRFSAEGLRDLFYFGQNLNLRSPMWTLGTIGVVAIAVIFLSLVKKYEKPASKTAAAQSLQS